MSQKPKFVDREHELSAAANLIQSEGVERPRVQIWQAHPATGLTTFLQHAAERQMESRILLYIDCRNKATNNVFSQIVISLQRRYPEVWHEFKSWIDERLSDERKATATAAALAGLPWIGPTLAAGSIESLSPIAMTDYASSVVELFCEYLIQLTAERGVILFLDNAQEIDAWSLDLLRTTVGHSYQGLKYIAGYVLRPPLTTRDARDFQHKNHQLGYVVKASEFPQPDATLVRGLCSTYDIDISGRFAATIAQAADGNIYRILTAIHQLAANDAQQPPYSEPLTSIQESVLDYIKVAGQALRVSDILALCSRAETLFFSDEHELLDNIDSLVAQDLLQKSPIPPTDELLALTRSSAPGHEFPERARYLQCGADLYAYFARVRDTSIRHSPAEVTPILYRLSKDLDIEHTPIWIQDLITYSLSLGSTAAAERFIRDATAPHQHTQTQFHDHMANAAFLISLRHHQTALNLLRNPHQAHWRKQRASRILEAIALNRCREHEKSELLTDKLIDTARSKEEIALLASYYIAGKLHQNQVKTAQSLYRKFEPLIGEAKNLGYFLRNSADAFPAQTALEILTCAVDLFKQNGDKFGYASTRSNRAAKLVELGKVEEALQDSKEAYEILDIFGIHHVHIVLNNLGICHFFLGDENLAQVRMRKGLMHATTKMPWIFLNINLAAALLVSGEAQSALETIYKIESDAAEYPVDRVRQRAYINFALIGLFAGASEPKVRRWCLLAKHHPDRMDLKMTADRVALVSHYLNMGTRPPLRTFAEWFLPCYLMYWYQNPLQCLPTDALASKTEIEDSGY